MLAPFAALENRLNDAVQARLSNAVATYQGGEPFGVLFERVATDPFSGAIDTASQGVSFPITSAPGIAEGAELMIDAVAYIVTGQVQPDAGGWLALAIYPKAIAAPKED